MAVENHEKKAMRGREGNHRRCGFLLRSRASTVELRRCGTGKQRRETVEGGERVAGKEGQIQGRKVAGNGGSDPPTSPSLSLSVEADLPS
ncbi:hypothetical protein CRG98_041751 [Punica granatum]|uniref:Uncharacterized protein n=1 Tax=Punica granatum TaxID=22663 RepID=A0A2I0I1M5_PUNGR|nr:hypothetical protein CRG98_041751 [Punica granatum]